jgi:hypothetical protein
LLTQQGNEVHQLGSSTLDGVSVQGYSVSISKPQLSADLASANLPSWLRSALASVNLGTLNFQVYVDNQGRLRSETTSMNLSVASAPLSVSETLNFSNYGSPVDIVPPPSGQVISFEQFLQDAAAATGPATQAGSCIEAVPAGSSTAATSYLNSVNADYPGWVQVTQLMESNGGQADLQALELQSKIDTTFLHQLRSITFIGAAVQPAHQLEADLSSYLSGLADAQASNGQQSAASASAMEAASTDRANASAALRQALGLPASSCSILRP